MTFTFLRQAAVTVFLISALASCSDGYRSGGYSVGEQLADMAGAKLLTGAANGLGRYMGCKMNPDKCPDPAQTAIAPAAGPASTPAAGYHLSAEDARKLCLAYPAAQRPEECEQVLAQD